MHLSQLRCPDICIAQTPPPPTAQRRLGFVNTGRASLRNLAMEAYRIIPRPSYTTILLLRRSTSTRRISAFPCHTASTCPGIQTAQVHVVPSPTADMQSGSNRCAPWLLTSLVMATKAHCATCSNLTFWHRALETRPVLDAPCRAIYIPAALDLKSSAIAIAIMRPLPGRVS
jgi:hypothetical protein